MTEINIPVAIVGPGSQPAEMDGAEMDILQMPSGMDTYDAPLLPEPEEVHDLREAKSALNKLLAQMQDYDVDMPALRLDLDSMDRANCELVDQVLGEGEVSLVFTGDVKARIQESVLAGVWRVKYLDADDALLRDVIEVAAIPSIVQEATFAAAQNAVDSNPEKIPEGVTLKRSRRACLTHRR
jgi:hydrogenase-1 operon protein HyaF